MAINNKDNVSATIGNKIVGAFFRHEGAYAGAVTPTTNWVSAGFENYGLISAEDGVSYSRSADKNAANAWGRQKVKSTQNNQVTSITLTLIETTANTFKLTHGDANVDTDVNGFTQVKDTEFNPGISSIVILGLLDDGRDVIIFAREAEIDLNLEFAMNDDNITKYPITFEFLDNLTDRAKCMIWIENQLVTPGSGSGS